MTDPVAMLGRHPLWIVGWQADAPRGETDTDGAVEAFLVLDRAGVSDGIAWMWWEAVPTGDKAARCVRGGPVEVVRDDPGGEMLRCERADDRFRVLLRRPSDPKDHALMAAQAAARIAAGGTRGKARAHLAYWHDLKLGQLVP